MHQILVGIAVCALSFTQSFAGGPAPGEDPLVAGRAIVRLPAGAAIAPVLSRLQSDFPFLNPTVIDTIASRNLFLLQHAILNEAQIDQVENAFEITYVNDGLVMFGEFVYEGKAPEGSSGSIWVDGPAPAELYTEQYAVARVNLDTAHARSTGAGVVVAVLDTGIAVDHPALASQIAPGGFNFITNSAAVADAGDGLDNDGDGAVDELVGHGTYIAGLIALAAPEARLLPVTVLNSDGKSDNWIITKGVYHAMDRGVEVINMSLTSTYDSQAFLTAIDEAASLGIVVVAAAGNFNRPEPREYPAMEDDVPLIGVAATNDTDHKGGFSNYNDRLFLSAPGANVANGGSPVPHRSMVSALPTGGYGFSQGTSMATPLVSGAAALIRAQHPQWPASRNTVTLIRQTLASSSINIDGINPAYAGMLGAGRLDAGGATALWPPAPELGDLNNDGVVDVDDLLRVITDWGQVHSSADMNGNGMVDVDDLLTVIIHWG